MIISFLKEMYRNIRIRSLISKKFESVSIEPNVIVKGLLENLKLGKNVIIQSGCVLHLGGMDWCNNQGNLLIGENSVISPNCVIYATGPGIEIGKRFDCGPNVGIFSSRTDYESDMNVHFFAPVKIEDDVIVYANCVISPGVTIGKGAIIAAGSVVTKDIPENCLAGGSPAKVIKYMNKVDKN